MSDASHAAKLSYFVKSPTLATDPHATVITSRVSGRGHRIGAVFLSVCVSVYLCVSTLTAKHV